MEKIRTETQTVKVIERFCDICGNPAKGRHCRMCMRDMCEDHAHRHWDEWGGDGSYKYCTECWEIGESFRRRKSILSDIYEKDIEDLENAWKNAARYKIEKKKMKR